MNYTEIFVPITIFIVIGWIIKTVSDNKVRRTAIEKGEIDEKLSSVFSRENHRADSSMKWGMVLIAVGIALLIGGFYSYDVADEAKIGIMFLFAGGALLLYHFFKGSKNSKDANLPTENSP